MDENYQPQSRRERRQRERAPQPPDPAAPQAPPAQPEPSRRPVVKPATSSQATGWGATAPQPRVQQQADPGPATMPSWQVPDETQTRTQAQAQVPAAASAQGGEPPKRSRKGKKDLEPLGPVRGTIRVFGELCITAGLVMILFVAWQLWWTDIDANRDNEQLAQELRKDWEEPAELPEDPDTPIVGDRPDLNTAFGIVYIPRFGDDYYRTLAEGVSLEPVLNRMGLGRYPTSAMPGQEGNFALAGHRVTFGKPLNKIAELQPGDEIVVETKDGYYTYTFRNFDIVLPDDIDVLAPLPANPDFKGKDRIMTMTACNPMFSAQERYIAYSEMTEWRPAAAGPPDVIKDSGAYKKNQGGN